MISERIKLLNYHAPFAQSWFWRTTAKQGIDYLEQQNDILSAYELKWNMKRKASLPSSFRTAYPDVKFAVISSENIEELLLDNVETFL